MWHMFALCNVVDVQSIHKLTGLSLITVTNISIQPVKKQCASIAVTMGTIGTFSNADFSDGDGDRKSNLFPVDVLHFGGKPFSLRADVRTENFPLSTKSG